MATAGAHESHVLIGDLRTECFKQKERPKPLVISAKNMAPLSGRPQFADKPKNDAAPVTRTSAGADPRNQEMWRL